MSSLSLLCFGRLMPSVCCVSFRCLRPLSAWLAAAQFVEKRKPNAKRKRFQFTLPDFLAGCVCKRCKTCNFVIFLCRCRSILASLLPTMEILGLIIPAYLQIAVFERNVLLPNGVMNIFMQFKTLSSDLILNA